MASQILLLLQYTGEKIIITIVTMTAAIVVIPLDMLISLYQTS
jgi:hypothetical protein